MLTMKSSTLSESDIIVGIMYVQNNCNALRTARESNYSKSTVHYHIKRIKRIGGYDLSNPFQAVDFYYTYHERGNS